jgi:nitrite reductase (NADH) large subunit
MRYVIIGNGVAGTTAAENIRKLDGSGSITIISDEEYPFYSRIRLIELLGETAGIDNIILKNKEWYEKNKIDLILNDPVVDVNKNLKELTTRSGKTICYDKLLLASGSNSFVPPILGADKTGVFTLRRYKDAMAILDYIDGGPKNVIIVGGGVLGLEIGNSLNKTGHRITIIEAMERLLPRQMDTDGASILQSQLENFGFTFHIGLMTQEIVGESQVTGVKLNDGTEILCDVLIISAGVRPVLDLATNMDLSIDKGIVVNDDLSTNVPDIYAAGDGIIHNSRLYGIWPASEAQGAVAGINMAGGEEKYTGTTMSNVLKVVGIDLASIGEIDNENRCEQFVMKDSENFIYKKIVLDSDRIIGAIFYGDNKNWLKVKNAIESGKDIAAYKKNLKKWDLSDL